MKSLRASLLVALFFVAVQIVSCVSAYADGVWGKPAVDPYITEVQRKDPAVVHAKVHAAVEEAVHRGLVPAYLAVRFESMGVAVLAGQLPSGCRADTLTAGLVFALMMSGHKPLGNMTVGDWVLAGLLQPRAWLCGIEVGGTMYYLVIPWICYNVSFLIIQRGVCVPDLRCDDCGRKVEHIVSNDLGDGGGTVALIDLFQRAHC